MAKKLQAMPSVRMLSALASSSMTPKKGGLCSSVPARLYSSTFGSKPFIAWVVAPGSWAALPSGAEAPRVVPPPCPGLGHRAPSPRCRGALQREHLLQQRLLLRLQRRQALRLGAGARALGPAGEPGRRHRGSRRSAEAWDGRHLKTTRCRGPFGPT